MHRSRTTTLRLSLVFLLLLPGCNTFNIGSNPPISTVTPADVPTKRPTTQDHTLAPGLTQYGVVDPVALGNAHDAALSNTSYTYVKTVTEKYANGTLRARRTVKARVVGPIERFYVTTLWNLPRVPRTKYTYRRYEFWSDGTRMLMARTVGNNTTYQRVLSSALPASVSSYRHQIYALFRALDTRVVNRQTHDRTTLYRVESTEVTDLTVFTDGLTNRYENPRNVTFYALIDSRGIVHEYRIAYTATGTAMKTNVTIRIVETVRYTEIGSTTVERPSWYEAANQSATLPIPG